SPARGPHGAAGLVGPDPPVLGTAVRRSSATAARPAARGEPGPARRAGAVRRDPPPGAGRAGPRRQPAIEPARQCPRAAPRPPAGAAGRGPRPGVPRPGEPVEIPDVSCAVDLVLRRRGDRARGGGRGGRGPAGVLADARAAPVRRAAG